MTKDIAGVKIPGFFVLLRPAGAHFFSTLPSQTIEEESRRNNSLLLVVFYGFFPFPTDSFQMQKSMKFLQTFAVVLLLFFREQAFAFLVTTRRRCNHHRVVVTSFLSPSTSANEIIVINWDGCLADTVDWRTQVGFDAAEKAWPELQATVNAYEDTEWLHNKLAAICHVLSCQSGESSSSHTCEYALAVRLILEEQELDGGESDGKPGKYASRFHPQKVPQQALDDDDDNSRVISSGDG